MATVSEITDAAFAKYRAQQEAAANSPGAKNFLFAVDLAILAWGIAKKETYLIVIGGGFLAYHLLKGST